VPLAAKSCLMKRLSLITFLFFAVACRHPKTLPEQLKIVFDNHLQRIDEASVIDSIRILWKTAVNDRLGRIIDDSVYVREYSKVKMQLDNAKLKNDHDSIEIYEYEINHIQQVIDSISISIPKGDTLHSAGYLIGCAYYLTKGGIKKYDSTLVFLDTLNNLRFTEYLDTALSRSVKAVH